VIRSVGTMLMRNLTARLVILLMLALMLITGTTDYLRLSRERERLVNQAQQDLRIFAETLAVAVRQNIRRGRTTDELRELLDEILARPGLVAVAIFDPTGQVIAATIAPGTAEAAADEPVLQSLGTRRPVAAMVESGDTRILRHIQPFRWPGGKSAAIEVRHTLANAERDFRRAVQENIVSRLLVLAAFVLSIYALTRWNISRPIRSLIAGARAIGHGDLSQRIESARRDEIGQLAEEFNRMASNLQDANAELLRQAEERLRLEQEVQQAQKMATVGMLAAKVAHEIGTPLNVISGRAEVLSRTLAPERAERRHLDVIAGQIERITGIIRTLLDYTRPKRPNVRPEQLPPILKRVGALLADRGARRDVRIELELPPDLPAVLADPDQLQQLLLNLLLNAVDASPPGAVIRVTTGSGPQLPGEERAVVVRGKADRPCLEVHLLDSGKGMSAEELERAFEPFFSTKGGGKGTGLGLSIVEEIVRGHRGEIEIRSVPGRGTEAILRLPLAAAPGLPDAVPPAEAAGHA